MKTFEATKKLIDDVMTIGACPEKVPLFLNLQGWIVYHTAGYEYSEAVYDGEKILKSYEKAIRAFPADIYYDMGGFAAMFHSKCLGSSDYVLNDEKYSLNFKDVNYCSSEEDYLGLAEDPVKFLWNRFYGKKFQNLSPDALQNTLSSYLSLSNAHYARSAALKDQLKAQTGSFFLSDVPMYQPAFDYLFQYIVGIKGISTDMRRKAGLLMDALESLEQLFRGYMEKFSPALDKAVSPIQYQICMLGQTVTNAKQFNRFIWPHLGRVLNELAERNLKLYFMVEGNAGALLEHLEDLKSGMCALHVESDPLDELKKRFGDKFTYVGGMPVDVLGSESTENCVKYVKKILDQYAHEGNFVFTTNKGIVYERDASVENLKALCDTVNNFKI